MTVREMLRKMTSAELTEWMAYHSLQNDPHPQSTPAQQTKTGDVLKAMFAHKVIKKRK